MQHNTLKTLIKESHGEIYTYHTPLALNIYIHVYGYMYCIYIIRKLIFTVGFGNYTKFEWLFYCNNGGVWIQFPTG